MEEGEAKLTEIKTGGDYNPTLARQEHEQDRANYQSEAAKFRDRKPIGAGLEGYISKADRDLERAGIDVSWIPKDMKRIESFYLKCVNILNPIDKRENRTHKELLKAYKEFEDVGNEARDYLGYSADGSSTYEKDGLLYKERLLVKEIEKRDEIVRFLDNNISKASTRLESTIQLINEKATKREKGLDSLREDRRVYEESIDQYKRDQRINRKLITIYGDALSSYRDSISVLKGVDKAVQDGLADLQAEIEYTKIGHQEFAIVKSVQTAIPKIQEVLKKCDEIRAAREKKEEEQLRESLNVIQFDLKGKDRKPRTRIIQNELKQQEQGDDLLEQRVENVVANLYR